MLTPLGEKPDSMSEPRRALLLKRYPSSKSSKPMCALELPPSRHNTGTFRPQAVLIQVNVLGIGSCACGERPRQSRASSLRQCADLRRAVVSDDHHIAPTDPLIRSAASTSCRSVGFDTRFCSGDVSGFHQRVPSFHTGCQGSAPGMSNLFVSHFREIVLFRRAHNLGRLHNTVH